MEVARPNFIGKGRTLSSTRKTSCSSGWLRLVVQTTFAFITVASFILIVIMSVKHPHPAPVLRPTVPLRCHVQGCRVMCKDAPFFDQFEEDIIHAIMEAEAKCKRVYLNLLNPTFTDGTIPHTWLSRLRVEVHKLSIIGGNLRTISSGAFMAQFMGKVKSLHLQDLYIRHFESTSLVGLSSLRDFNIVNSRLEGVQQNALRPVDDTLETLSITESGEWDPVKFTGSRGFNQLTIVDFSHNHFTEILNKDSFIGLEFTKILYLNFCKIAAIGEGTFDYLKSIEVLYLNNNRLTTVPPGLFSIIVVLDNPRPRINLQDNYWVCDCSVNDLRQLIRKQILLVDVQCTFPSEFYSITFTQFEDSCNNVSDTQYENHTSYDDQRDIVRPNVYKGQLFYPDPVYFYANSCNSNFDSDSLKFITPRKYSECSSKIIDLSLSELVDYHSEEPVPDKSDWLRFSYFIQTDLFSVIQIGTLQEIKDYGLIWYQSNCPQEIYCLDTMPFNFKLYDADPRVRYIFCPINLKNSSIERNDCIAISRDAHAAFEHDSNIFRLVIYLTTMVLCSCFGAVVVYGLIRQKPTLLKGSKRVLIVKHKNVDALVFPPKIPLRNDMIDSKDNEVFTLTQCHNGKLKPPNVKRMKSVRSDKSGSPSYISAMQPTEDQLAEWRIRSHFNNDSTISSRKSELSSLSWVDTAYYYSIDESDTTYESLK